MLNSPYSSARVKLVYFRHMEISLKKLSQLLAEFSSHYITYIVILCGRFMSICVNEI